MRLRCFPCCCASARVGVGALPGLPQLYFDAKAPVSQERLTCKEAMAHPYFAPVREAEAQQQQEEAEAAATSDEEQAEAA